MTKKEAIKIFNEVLLFGKAHCTQAEFKELAKMSIQALEQEPRWIPVSEMLPKAYEFVNCTCHSLIDDRKDWVVETCYIPQLPNSPYSDWGNIPMLNSCKCEVIAWMHRDIPKPYKAESEG
jgi:hypothetical protein